MLKRISISKTLIVLILSMILLVSFSLIALADGITPMVQAGGYPNTFSVAVKSDGTVWTWGHNDVGQLGDNGGLRTMPAQIASLANIKKVALGWAHCLALKADGTVWAWGKNDRGQAGNPSLANQFAPFQIPNLQNVIAIAAGNDFSLALKSDGTVWGWGFNTWGQLGNRTLNSSATPTQTVVDNVVAISAGYSFGLALKADGTLMGWGENDHGQLGLEEDFVLRNLPIPIQGVSGITAIATGYIHCLALKYDGTLYSWGNNNCGELGDGSIDESRHNPLPIPNHNNFKTIFANTHSNLAVKNDGSVWAWGNNSGGYLGVGLELGGVHVPTLVKYNRDIISAGFNEEYGLMLKSDGSLRFCGYVYHGELGFQSNQSFNTPLFVNAFNLGRVFKPVIAAGTHHLLAVKAGKEVRAWGLNSDGQLGNNTTPNNSNLPVIPSGLSNAVSTAGGNWHSVALKDDGTVWSWGKNQFGQLGTGDYNNSDVPINAPASLTGIMAITAGESHSLALKNDGTVWAWGSNSFGQLGDNTTSRDVLSPVQTRNLTDVTAIAAGFKHSLALKADGTVWAWGNNYYGNLGNEDTAPQDEPVQVHNLTDVVAISSSPYADHSLALKSDGTVWAWGYNYYGQLGDNSTTNRHVPVQVSGLTNVVAIANGCYHSLALKDDGTVWAWGENYSNGQLGDGTWMQRFTPVQVLNLTNVITITAGNFHSAALKTDGLIWTWGANWYGQLGDNTFVSPKNIAGKVKNLNLGRVIKPQVSVALYSSGALKKDGTLKGWGYNSVCTLGVGSAFSPVPLPTATKELTDVVKLEHGYYHTLALKADGTVWSFGYNQYGQLGNNDPNHTNIAIPNQVQGLTDIVDIAAGGNHSIAVKADGTVWVWGLNNYGQLGDSNPNRDVPSQVAGFNDAIAAAAGYGHTLILKADGTVWAFGYNVYGQLGDGLETYTNTCTPFQIPNFNNVIKIDAGIVHSLAIKSDGTAWAWGANYSGQLGINNTTPKDEPNQVLNLSNIIDIRGGYCHSLALKSDNTVWVWGDNGYMQCNNSLIDVLVPEQVPNLTATAIGAGGYNNLAMKPNGLICSWGDNYYKQLGDYTALSKSAPFQTVKNLNLMVD